MSVSDEDKARLTTLLERVPYVKFLGMSADVAGDEVTAMLPFTEKLVGNVRLPAIHGGVVGAFMEMTALAQLTLMGGGRQPRTIDVTIDYLRPARGQTTYARARVQKAGRRIASVHVEAWQDDAARPVAAMRGHFMLDHDGD
jgi:uncharacterized protein (TIGR00369 family)